MALAAVICIAGVVDGQDDVFTSDCAAKMAALVPPSMPITDGFSGPPISSVQHVEFNRESGEVRVLANPAPRLAERLQSGEYVMRPAFTVLDASLIPDGPDRKIMLVERAEITHLAVIPMQEAVALERGEARDNRGETPKPRLMNGVWVQPPPPGPPPQDPPSEE